MTMAYNKTILHHACIQTTNLELMKELLETFGWHEVRRYEKQGEKIVWLATDEERPYIQITQKEKDLEGSHIALGVENPKTVVERIRDYLKSKGYSVNIEDISLPKYPETEFWISCPDLFGGIIEITVNLW